MIRWGGKDYSPKRPGKPNINQSIEDLMKPLSEKAWKGNVWRAQYIMNVQKDGEPEPEPTPSPTPTNTETPTNTPTPSATPQVQWNAEVGFYAGYSINSNNWFEIGYPTEGYLTFFNIASNGTRWAATGRLETGNLDRTFYSDNGSTWITGNNSPFTFMGSTLDLTSNGDMFVLGGSSTYTQILSGDTFTTIGYSYDGITYSSGTITVESGRAKPSSIRSTAFNGDMWLGVGFSSGATANRTVMINSYDGINWSGITNTLWTGSTEIDSITYGNGRWVATSNLQGNDRIAVSYDGFNWTGSTNAADSTNFGTATGGFFIDNVIWFNDKFIAGSNASGATTHTVCYSYDGFEWFPATSTKTLISRVNIIASNKSDFVMIGGQPSGRIYQSTDGINWSANTTDQAVVFNNGAIARLSNKLPEQQSPNPSQTPSQTPTNTETPTQTPTPTPTPTTPPDSDYQAILNYATSQGYTLPSASGQTLQNDLVVSLKSAGIWNDLDIFYVFATDGDSDFSRINWKNPSSFEVVETGTVTFNTNQGWNATSGGYLATNFTPSTQSTAYTVNDASRIYYDYDNDSTVPAIAYDGNVVVTTNFNADCWNGTNVNTMKIASENNIGGTFDNTGTGLKMIQRTASATIDLYNNSPSGTTRFQSSTGLDIYPHTILRYGSGSGNYSSNICSLFGMGASLSGMETDLYTTINNYMNSI
jgi:hypothetical protein